MNVDVGDRLGWRAQKRKRKPKRDLSRGAPDDLELLFCRLDRVFVCLFSDLAEPSVLIRACYFGI